MFTNPVSPFFSQSEPLVAEMSHEKEYKALFVGSHGGPDACRYFPAHNQESLEAFRKGSP